MIFKKNADLTEADVTPYQLYKQRRRFIKTGLAAIAGAGFPWLSQAKPTLGNVLPGPYSTEEEKTPYKDVTTYNNFYEFGTSKSAPAIRAQDFRTEPWSVSVSGECDKPGVIGLEDILKPHPLEQRIYRLRCVEGWSMVIPWVGFPLADFIKRFQPNSRARFVEFQTLNDKEQMPGVRRRILDWPYTEGLRMDEAMHPLSLLAVGLYDEVLPNQNGAPIRLVVPWKYGFKSIKSIVSVRFTERRPVSSWEQVAPKEYGFYANVNPAVSHPRWSQKRERRIGELVKRKTLVFNGYAEQVASLYAGMDLAKYY
jgi:methionine sulfoxide reductase catalytic subunit